MGDKRVHEAPWSLLARIGRLGRRGIHSKEGLAIHEGVLVDGLHLLLQSGFALLRHDLCGGLARVHPIIPI